jgi:outer membrane protein OmpA-like peptidoglycan-associated protein
MKQSLRFIALVAILCSTTIPLYAFNFRYHYTLGEQYRFVGNDSQKKYIEGDKTAIVQNMQVRMAYRVAEVTGNSGRLIGNVHTSEVDPNNNGASLWSNDYPSDFWRDEQGHYTVAPSFFKPMVRNVPLFPKGEVAEGEKWQADGEEVLDLRTLTGLKAPFIIPFNGQYRYIGPVQLDGKSYQKIAVNYSYNHVLPKPLRARKVGESYLTAIETSYEQELYWDSDLGQIAYYSERYATILTDSNGIRQITEGEANARLVEAIPMDKEDLKATLKEQAEKLDMGNLTIEEADKGVKLTLDDIKFKADTNEFLNQHEADKVAKIGKLLQGQQGRDIVITGHTAATGNNLAEQKLSEERALAVANYLIQLGYRTKENLIIEGKGGSNPIANNTTNEGKARNRRVEITILEN